MLIFFYFSYRPTLDLTRFPSMFLPPFLGSPSARALSQHWTHKGMCLWP